jgi:hypothetical protein
MFFPGRPSAEVSSYCHACAFTPKSATSINNAVRSKDFLINENIKLID